MKYDRRILVPYLRSVMEIEMIYNMLLHKRIDYSDEISGLEWDASNLKGDRRKEEYYEKYDYGENIKLIMTGIASIVFIPALVFVLCGIIGLADSILGIFGITIWQDSWSWNITKVSFGLAIIFCIGSIIIAISERRRISKENKLRVKKYRAEENKRHLLADTKKNEAVSIRQKRSLLDKQIIMASTVRDEIYSVNIIPNQFRDVSSVTYLYDYISTSRENDLDKVIQTLLLDNINIKLNEITERLDDIFNSINEMKRYLNKISGGIKELNQSSINIQKGIANVEKNAELQNDYLNMIESNTKAAAYIGAATYLRAFH